MAMELLGYNFSAIGSSPYGNYWRQSRKIATIELLSNHRLEELKHVRECEVKASIKGLFEDCKTRSSGKVLLDMKHLIQGIVFDIIFKIIAGKHYTSQEGSDLQELVTKYVALLDKFVVSDALPFLRWLDIGGSERIMRETAKEFDIIFQEWLNEHKMKNVMVSSLDDNAEQLPDYDLDTFIRAMGLALIIAGADTTTLTLTWTIALLLNNPNVLKKAQNELDIQAILKETMRLYPVAPLLLPHESREDCTVCDYHVPAGTQLFVNAWNIHRDPRVWNEPLKFTPERFLTMQKDIDFRGQNFEMIPFGAGRRMCPGISFALQVMQLLLASLLHGFVFATPSNEPVEMGKVTSKATPLEVILTPRLSASLYV